MANRDGTLAGSGKGGSSPRMQIGCWGGNEDTRKVTAISERCGMVGLFPKKKICRSTVEELARVLQRVVVLAFLGQNKSRVRFLWMVERMQAEGEGRGGPEW
jgi:hypothetical protein